MAGSAQLCARQRLGCEAAVHTIEDIMSDPSVEGVLMVDAWNAFNSLNRAVCSATYKFFVLHLAVPAINFYRSKAKLFVGEETILSQEGKTQGDPLSMAIYALFTLPLKSKISRENPPPPPKKNLGSPMMLVEEHPPKPFTNGGQNHPKKAQSWDNMLIHQKHGC